MPILLAQKKKIDRDTLIGSFLMGVFAFAGCLFQQLGIIYSTVSKSSFITALYIVFVPVIEFLLGKKVNQKIWLSVGIAILGLFFMHELGFRHQYRRSVSALRRFCLCSSDHRHRPLCREV
ncbi:MAG: EamA family transporter [Erysipelotrichaceae bacterium]|nr:EamA family transporter [Erysipelotrichaceae bacterium]